MTRIEELEREAFDTKREECIREERELRDDHWRRIVAAAEHRAEKLEQKVERLKVRVSLLVAPESDGVAAALRDADARVEAAEREVERLKHAKDDARSSQGTPRYYIGETLREQHSHTFITDEDGCVLPCECGAKWSEKP